MKETDAPGCSERRVETGPSRTSSALQTRALAPRHGRVTVLRASGGHREGDLRKPRPVTPSWAVATGSASCTPPGWRLRHFVRRFPVRAQSDRTFDFGKPKLRGILPSRPDFTSSVQRPQKRSGHTPLRFSY